MSTFATMKFLKAPHRLFFLLLALCLNFPLRAQEPRPAATTRHSLWKVQGKQNTVYLLGSIHLLKKDNYPLPAAMESAFTNSAIVVFETDLSAAEDLTVAMSLMSKAQLPEGQTLKDVLSPEVYQSFTNHASQSPMPLEMLVRFTPGMAATTLEGLEMMKLGFDPELGLDLHFYKLAKNDGKQIVPLESIGFQIGLLNGLSKEEADWFMKETLKDLDNVKTDSADMVKYWQTGESDKLAEMLDKGLKESAAIYKRLVTDRNRNWIPKIEELARGNKNAIIIVGAGHLVGKEGLVESLKKDGFKVTQE
jgi:Uncharacterized protein conserved in bacteria